MISVIEGLARPFRPILPPKTLALAIALTIRFVPTLLTRAEQIRQSWRARSPRRPGWRTLLPTTLAALDDADHVAEALRARGGLG
jgi:biotin transport system permease protein